MTWGNVNEKVKRNSIIILIYVTFEKLKISEHASLDLTVSYMTHFLVLRIVVKCEI